jgi:hypothetical protein
VMERALAKAPQERYPTGTALAQAVEEAWGLDLASPGDER